ncbi:MAG: enolase C-terminal domain-like protein [Candidatus Limnocylindria bacterium]
MNIARLEASAYRILTDRPEADGTLDWDSTTIVVVEAVGSNGWAGLGYSYTAAAAVPLIAELLAPEVSGRSTAEVPAVTEAMVRRVRNVGLAGLVATAISAVDVALWDLRARELGLALVDLLGRRRDAVDVYGSGLFTTYAEDELARQACDWVEAGIRRVKMKIGLDAGQRAGDDLVRVAAVRRRIGDEVELMVDANGAYRPKQAALVAGNLAASGVSYFEEPVPSNRPADLAFVRRSAPMDVAAGEYAYSSGDFLRLLRAEAVDILQADATRCLGATGWQAAAALAEAFGVGFSAHTAPALHAHLGCTAPRLDHVEYFHDHVRIEGLLFDGVPGLVDGRLQPDHGRPGLGLEFKRRDAARWRVA